MKPRYVFGVLFFIAVAAFALRLITSTIPFDDPLYNLRQIDSLVANNLSYQWFDPLNWYHSDATVYWGPLFPMMVAAMVMVTGINTVVTASFVPPILAALITIPVFFLGRTLGDWKTGLLASIFTAVIGGQFFYRSTFGFVDHHIAEVLFSTLFCLLYICALKCNDYNKTVVLSFFTGLAYLLGFLTMPTMILFAMIVGVYTVVAFIIKPDRNLVVINFVVFGTAILGALLFGIKTSGYGLSVYSIGHPLVYLGLIVTTGVLFVLSTRLSKQVFTPVVGIITLIILAFTSSTLLAFFGQSTLTNTVAEAMGWSIVQAAMSFNIGLLLALGGGIVLVLNYIRTKDTSTIFVLIWTAVVLFSTWQHVRYEYYIAVNIALLSAVFAVWLYNGHTTKYFGIILASMFIIFSVFTISTIPPAPTNDDFKDSLIWLKDNSPDPGISYDKIYTQPFTYPEASYSVMSWWDYGHAITYYAHRIPVSNPFQQGVAGPVGAAAYFMSTNITSANEILAYHHTKYVIVNDKMATNDLWAMAAWANITPDYNETMVVKLYNGVVPGYALVHEVGSVKTFEYEGVI